MTELRLLGLHDVEWAYKLYDKNRQHFFEKDAITKRIVNLWAELNFFENKYGNNLETHAIIYNGNQVGVIQVKHEPDCKYLLNIIIAKEYRRKGIFKETIRILKARYPEPFKLVVKPNNKEAIKAYEKVCFEINAIELCLNRT